MESYQTQRLFDEICRLPPEKLAMVEEFIEFLKSRDEKYVSVDSFCMLSEKTFQRVWDNQEDADYDNL
jgi:hypothetical protein